jgi:hypothetical protein
MTDKSKTSFENKCKILAELWNEMRDAEDFEDFIEFNDVGLPLAHVLVNNAATANEASREFINETFELLLDDLYIEDKGYSKIRELLDESGNYN